MYPNESQKKLIQLAEKMVEEIMSKYDPSHDSLHVNRVRKTALYIANHLQSQSQPDSQSPSQIDLFVVELSALFHDINDKKYSPMIGLDFQPKSTHELLLPFFDAARQQAPELDLEADGRAALICEIIDNVSWSTESKLHETGGLTAWHKMSLELQCVQDADRLDAIGAIGVMRCAAFSAVKNRPLHNPLDKNSAIQHFHDKLLKIKGRLKTDIGKQLAEKRHQFMLQFLTMIEEEVNL